MISFDTTSNETFLIMAIIDRAGPLLLQHAPTLKYARQEMHMDLAACHANGCELRLEELRNASDYEFMHDVLGIRKHINRNTGKLGPEFKPRFSR